MLQSNRIKLERDTHMDIKVYIEVWDVRSICDNILDLSALAAVSRALRC